MNWKCVVKHKHRQGQDRVSAEKKWKRKEQTRHGWERSQDEMEMIRKDVSRNGSETKRVDQIR